MKYEFRAIPSGDYEDFCFDVDRETFIRLKGREPRKRDKSAFFENRFRIYPDDLIDFQGNEEFNFKFEFEEVEK